MNPFESDQISPFWIGNYLLGAEQSKNWVTAGAEYAVCGNPIRQLGRWYNDRFKLPTVHILKMQHQGGGKFIAHSYKR